ncbi:MAG: citrate synthase [Myxococcales bacterium]|nr:citrate synthase [Myxococcales bacterium]
MGALGLEGVVAAETEMSMVDGQTGQLVIRGWPVAKLAAVGQLEAAMALLWDSAVPTLANGAVHRQRLGAARVAAWPWVQRVLPLLPTTDAMAALRSGASLVQSEDPHALVASLAALCAAWDRRRRGLDPIAPSAQLPHAHDLVRMLGVPESQLDARGTALGRYLCTIVDHGMNASTFTARVVASTQSDVVSAVVAAIGALKGPLHGGAPGPVLDMLDAIGTPQAASTWIEAELDAGRRIMGMGHRVYKVRDPRAAVLEEALHGLSHAGVASDRLALAKAVEQAAEAALQARKPGRRLRANVEFYTAVLLDAVGVHRSLFTPLFACGRAVGWLAHVDEHRRTGRLIRPKSAYVGPAAA